MTQDKRRDELITEFIEIAKKYLDSQRVEYEPSDNHDRCIFDLLAYHVLAREKKMLEEISEGLMLYVRWNRENNEETHIGIDCAIATINKYKGE